MIATERLYLTSDRKAVVSESDPKAAFLLVAKGGELSDKLAAQYGLGKIEAAPEVDKGENRAVSSKKITKR